MSGVVPVSLAGIVDVPEMLTYYVDRIIARRDVSRLTDPLVQEHVRCSINIYTDRFPEFARLFDTAEHAASSTAR